MKLQTSLLALFIVTIFVSGYSAATPEVIIHMPAEKAEEFLEWTIKCISKGDYDSKVLEYIKEGKYMETDQTIQALVCAIEKFGYGYENGRINVEKVMTELFPNKPEIGEAIVACDKEYGSTPELNFKGMLICFRDKSYKIKL